ncbi:UNVERIFIED_CONTAM: Respiratory burst oxidaseprotein E [Sesamum radiatum]|uniref:Respiratory burst oxidaseprotein E n=1 Tax=Sesamum radiatum TaxID=300843 RepID=A0AAW2R3B6_SESRA
MLSASANRLSNLQERAEEYASLIMEELDPHHLHYIELEALLLQRDNYINYNRALSTSSIGRGQNVSTTFHFKPTNLVENWQRTWILLLWVMAMAGLFTWKFLQYRERAAFQVMGYCLTTAKGAAETLKLNMALVLLPVCRNILTWLRSTKASLFIPLDDNINFHKVIACAIAIGTILHAGNHLTCDFPRIIRSTPQEFALIASDFHAVKPTYGSLLTGVVGLTGIAMVTFMIIAYSLATQSFRKNGLKLPTPFNRLTGFNAFWYSHHLFGLVYILLLIHGTFLLLIHKWYQKTTWMYISVPLLLYTAERSLRTCRAERYAVKILKVSVLPGGVFSLIMAKPNGFKYKSGQHPFSLTSAPGDEYLSVHIRTVGDWTQELKQVFTEDNSSACVIGRAKFGALGNVLQAGQPKLLVDGPYGAPAQDYQNYDVLLLDSNTETSISDDSSNSVTSSSSTGKKKSQRTRNAYFYWVTREPASFEWFKGVMNEVAEMDCKHYKKTQL